MTDEQALELYYLLVSAFPSKELSDESTALFLGRFILEDFDLARVAVDYVIDNNKFFPSWAEVKSAIPCETDSARAERVESIVAMREAELEAIRVRRRRALVRRAEAGGFSPPQYPGTGATQRAAILELVAGIGRKP